MYEILYNDGGLISGLRVRSGGGPPYGLLIGSRTEAALLIGRIRRGDVEPVGLSVDFAMEKLSEWIPKEKTMESLITPTEQVTPGYWWARYCAEDGEPTEWGIVRVEGVPPFMTVQWVDDYHSRIYPGNIKNLEFGRKIEEMPEDVSA